MIFSIGFLTTIPFTGGWGHVRVKKPEDAQAVKLVVPTYSDQRNGTMTQCGHAISLCMLQHDAKNFVFTAYDKNMNLFDVSGAAELVVGIYESVRGALLLMKTLTGGSVTLNNPHQFSIRIVPEESSMLPAGRLYCEVRMITPAGVPATLGQGTFHVEDTRIGDV